MMRRRHAFTLIEIIVSLIAGGVILIALGTVMLSMSGDQQDAGFWRDGYYFRFRGNQELEWTMRQIPRRGLRQTQADWNALLSVGTTDPNIGGVLTYVRDYYTQANPMVASGAVSYDGTLSATGIIFQYYSVLYKYEDTIKNAVGTPANPVTYSTDPSKSGFNSMSASQLAAWIQSDTNRAKCDVLAASVDVFTVNCMPPTSSAPPAYPGYSVAWNLVVGR
jgi:hypothetical protein